MAQGELQEKTQFQRGALLVLAGALCFSTTGFAQAVAPEGATPFVLGALRMLVGGVALWLWCLWRDILPARAHWPVKNVALSALALLGCQLFFFKGILLNGVAIGTVVSVGFTPVSAALLARVFLGEVPVKAWYPATMAAITGLALLSLGGGEQAEPLYLLFPLGTGFCYACYLVFSKPLARHHEPEAIMMLLCLTSGVVMWGLLLYDTAMAWLHAPSGTAVVLYHPLAWILTPEGLGVVLHLGVVTAAAAFSLTLAGLRSTSAAVASTLGLAEPLCASLLGILCLHERPTTFSFVGLACIFAGAGILIFFAPRPSRDHQQ